MLPQDIFSFFFLCFFPFLLAFSPLTSLSPLSLQCALLVSSSAIFSNLWETLHLPPFFMPLVNPHHFPFAFQSHVFCGEWFSENFFLIYYVIFIQSIYCSYKFISLMKDRSREYKKRKLSNKRSLWTFWTIIFKLNL